MIRDLLCGPQPVAPQSGDGTAGALRHVRPGSRGAGWHFVPAIALPRKQQDVFVERYVRDALIHLNPAIAAQPDRADEVIYKLRAIVLSVRSDGLVSANEEFTAWLRGERSMPFGPNHEHVTVRLVDFGDLSQNQYTVATQYTFRAGPAERRADLVLLVNGLPLVLVEAKTPVRNAVSWVDGALQVHNDYERYVPELFACNVFSVATEGKELRYGSIHMPIEQWGPWRPDDARIGAGLLDLKQAVTGLLRPNVLLDILANFTLLPRTSSSAGSRSSAAISSMMPPTGSCSGSWLATPKKGLIWHFQGSGKSLLMVFAAQKLRMQPDLRNPTVIIAVDRIDLDSQISATFHASDIPNLVKAETREELEQLLRQDTRKIIITTIFKFGEAEGLLNGRAEHRCPGGRGAPHPGGQSGHPHAGGAAQRLFLWPDRHAHQPPRPQHLCHLWRGGRQAGLHEPLQLRRVDSRRRHAAAALRAAAGGTAHRQGSHRRGLPGTDGRAV